MGDPFLFEECDLPNGARLFHQRRDMEWTALSVVITAGHLHDPVGKEGTGHLLEHHLSSGSIGGLPPMSDLELSEWLERSGMTANLGATGMDFMRFGGAAPNDTFGELAGFLTDLVFRPGLDGDLEGDREDVRSECADRMRGRSDLIDDTIERALLGDHRYVTATGLPADGVLDGITAEDVKAWHDRYCGPPNARFVTIGNTDVKDVAATLSNLISVTVPGGFERVVPTARFARLPDPREIRFPAADGRSAKAVDMQWLWAYAERVPPSIVIVTKVVLRKLLHDRVRQQAHLAYHVDTSIVRGVVHDRFSVSTAVMPGRVEAVNAIVAETLSDADGIRRLVPRVRQGAALSFRLADLSISNVLMDAIDDVVANGRIVSHGERLANLLAVTEEDVLRFVSERLDPARALTVLVERN